MKEVQVPVSRWGTPGREVAESLFAWALDGIGDKTQPAHDSVFLDATCHRRYPLTAEEEAGLPFHPDRLSARLMAIADGKFAP